MKNTLSRKLGARYGMSMASLSAYTDKIYEGNKSLPTSVMMSSAMLDEMVAVLRHGSNCERFAIADRMEILHNLAIQGWVKDNSQAGAN